MVKRHPVTAVTGLLQLKGVMRRFKVLAWFSLASVLLLVHFVYTVHRETAASSSHLALVPVQHEIPHNLLAVTTIQPYAYSSRVIQKSACVITVLLVEPTLDTAVMASLESVAAFVHPRERTCILIQTALCPFQSNNETDTDEMAYQRLIEFLYGMARPLLKNMIRSGNVRVTILNHTRYQLQGCDYFYSPSNPWLNYFYWNDYLIDDPHAQRVGEFVHGQDADLVLTIQRDAVLCHDLDARAWKEFSFVGAPWPPSPEWWSCSQLRANWITWHSSSSTNENEIPPYPSEADFCTNPNIGPIGNGGLSLRSRLWMQRAIEYCPDRSLSGLTVQSYNNTCSTFNTGNEDIYFATILRGFVHNHLDSSLSWTKSGTNHSRSSSPPLKLPTMLEAAFFATETQWVSDMVRHYNTSSKEIEATVQKLEWWNGKYYDNKISPSNVKSMVEDGRARFQRMKLLEVNSLGKKPILPIGLHKFWKYAGKELLDNEESYTHFMNECPYLKDIMPA